MTTIAGHITQWPDGRWHFPTLASCLVCGGMTSIVRPYPQEYRYEPEEALRLALIEHGYMLAKWEGTNTLNARHVPRACRCGHAHNFVRNPGLSRPGQDWITCDQCGHTQGKPGSSD